MWKHIFDHVCMQLYMYSVHVSFVTGFMEEILSFNFAFLEPVFRYWTRDSGTQLMHAGPRTLYVY